MSKVNEHFRALCAEAGVEYEAACRDGGVDFGEGRYRVMRSAEGLSLLDRYSSTCRRLSSDETLADVEQGDADVEQGDADA